MRKIGTIENHYHVYMNDKKKFIIKFETPNHTIAIDNIKWFDENSEETLNFVADLILDEVVVGRCSNAGRGGNADYYIDSEYHLLAKNISQEVSTIQNYCFPTMTENFSDVLDVLANKNVTFIENKVKTIKKAKEIIDIYQKNAEKYRAKYSH